MPVPPMPPAGSVVFHAMCKPALGADDYELRVDQILTGGEGRNATDRLDSGDDALPGVRRYPFTVDGPRFTLDSGLIHAVFPPTNGVGTYVSRLPMIVLRRRTLPWERVLPGTAETPWLAVLLFEEQEVTTLSPCTVGDVLEPTGVVNCRGPRISGVDATTKAQPCIGLEIALDLFHDIAPMAAEVPLLCHVRQVNTQDKELLGLDEDGWFSVVVGNRIPEPGKRYVACLVSLEGLQDDLPTAAQAAPLTALDLTRPTSELWAGRAAEYSVLARTSQPGIDPQQLERGLLQRMVEADNPYAVLTPDPVVANTGSLASIGASESHRWRTERFADIVGDLELFIPAPRLRLFCLAQWKFECREGGDFEAIMQALPANGGVGMLGLPPSLTQAPGSVPVAAWNAALDTGHVPLEHLTREGERTIAWYRGPLTSVGVTRQADGPFHTADQARRLDPVTGLENLGYAAAFEIGRLLALGDPRFALDLLRWRRGDRLLVDVDVTRDVFDRFAAQLVRGLAPDARLFGKLPAALASTGLRQVGTVIMRGALGVLGDPGGLRDVRDRLPGLQVEAIASARGLDAGVVRSLVEPTIVGGGALLDELQVGELPALVSDLDQLVTGAAVEFAGLDDVFTATLRGLARDR